MFFASSFFKDVNRLLLRLYIVDKGPQKALKSTKKLYSSRNRQQRIVII